MLGAAEIGKEVGEIASEQEFGSKRSLTDEEYSMKVGAIVPNAIAAIFGLRGFKGGGLSGSGGEAVASLTVPMSKALVSAGTGPLSSEIAQTMVKMDGPKNNGPGNGKQPESVATEKPKPPDKAQTTEGPAKSTEAPKAVNRQKSSNREDISRWENEGGATRPGNRRGDQSQLSSDAEQAVEKMTGVDRNPLNGEGEFIPGTGKGGKRILDFKLTGERGSFMVRGSLMDAKASGSGGKTFGALSSRDRSQIRDAINFVKDLRAQDPETFGNLKFELFTDVEAPTTGEFADYVNQGLLRIIGICR